jgi:hypothetical protein
LSLDVAERAVEVGQGLHDLAGEARVLAVAFDDALGAAVEHPLGGERLGAGLGERGAEHADQAVAHRLLAAGGAPRQVALARHPPRLPGEAGDAGGE